MNPGSCTLYSRVNKVCLPLSLRIRHVVRTAKKSEICDQKIYVRSFCGNFTRASSIDETEVNTAAFYFLI